MVPVSLSQGLEVALVFQFLHLAPLLFRSLRHLVSRSRNMERLRFRYRFQTRLSHRERVAASDLDIPKFKSHLLRVPLLGVAPHLNAVSLPLLPLCVPTASRAGAAMVPLLVVL